MVSYHTTRTTLSLVCSFLLIGSAQAIEGADSPDDRPFSQSPRHRVWERFDEDGDGRLNEDERARARAALRDRHQGRGSGGRRGDGRGPLESRPLDPEFDRPGRPDRDFERGPRGRGPDGRRGRGPEPAEIFQRFDEDGDDQLSRAEFMRLARVMRALHGGPPRGGADDFRDRRQDGSCPQAWGRRSGWDDDFRGEPRGPRRGPPRQPLTPQLEIETDQ